MTASTYLLFPDAREQEATLKGLSSVGQSIERSPAALIMGFRAVPALTGFPPAWRAHTVGIDPLVMMDAISRVPWEHPAKVMYRSDDEATWSFVTVNWRGPDPWGEPD